MNQDGQDFLIFPTKKEKAFYTKKNQGDTIYNNIFLSKEINQMKKKIISISYTCIMNINL